MILKRGFNFRFCLAKSIIVIPWSLTVPRRLWKWTTIRCVVSWISFFHCSERAIHVSWPQKGIDCVVCIQIAHNKEQLFPGHFRAWQSHLTKMVAMMPCNWIVGTICAVSRIVLYPTEGLQGRYMNNTWDLESTGTEPGYINSFSLTYKEEISELESKQKMKMSSLTGMVLPWRKKGDILLLLLLMMLMATMKEILQTLRVIRFYLWWAKPFWRLLFKTYWALIEPFEENSLLLQPQKKKETLLGIIAWIPFHHSRDLAEDGWKMLWIHVPKDEVYKKSGPSWTG